MNNDFLNKFNVSANLFLKKVFLSLEEKKIDVSDLFLDHICFRVKNIEDYNDYKFSLNKISKLLIESPVNGRNISTFRLNSPIIFNERQIFLIELPEPKMGTNHLTGFEHVEFVIDESFKSFSNHYPNLKFNWNFVNKTNNPELKLSLSDTLVVKFHHQSLKKIIEKEQREKMNDINETNKNSNNDSNINSIKDDSFEKLLRVLGSYVMNGLDEVVDFSSKSDEQRDEIVKACLKSLEISTVITSKLFDRSTFDYEKLDSVSAAIDNQKFEEANIILNK